MVRPVLVVVLALLTASCAEGAPKPKPIPPLVSTTSSSVPQVQVPALVGQSLEDAQVQLRSVGLEPGSDDHEPATPGRAVTDQVPAAGEKIDLGEGVTLYTR